jgi:MFS family permease
MFTVFTVLWQQVYGWSAISTAVHMIPSGVASFVISFSGGLSQRVRPKYLILGGLILVIGATVLLAFADGPDKYWPLVFPAFCIGSAGAMLVFVHVNVAIFAAAPPTEAGTVGAMYNGALQLGSAVGIAAATSVESSIEARSAAGFDGYEGRRAVFWFIVGVAALEAAAVAAFYRARRDSCENSGAIDQMLDAPDRGERPPPTEEVKDGRSVHSQVV